MSSPSLFAPVQNAFDVFSGYVDMAHRSLNEVEDTIVKSLKGSIPVAYQPLAEKVSRAIPETISMGCMLSGKLKLCAYAYGAARLLWTALPLAGALVHGRLEKEPVTQALEQTKQRLGEVVKRFSPAIMVTCAVNAVSLTALGCVSFSPSRFYDGLMHGLYARLAYEAANASILPQPK